jgi:hypothetical protein
MRISNNSSNWTGWIPYKTTYSWRLHNSTYGGNKKQGLKRVYVIFKEADDDISSIYKDAIIYDRYVPFATGIKINRNFPYTYSAYDTLNLSAIDRASGVRWMRFTNGHSRWTQWKRYRKTFRWDLTERKFGGKSSKGKKCVFAQFMDGVGRKSRSKVDCIIFKEYKYIEIDLSSQRLFLYGGGKKIATYKISSGRLGMRTPTGNFRVLGRERNHWSVKYKLYMPYAIRFYGGAYIHELPYWPGGYREGRWHLGIPVSHGCVRLGIGPAKRVYNFAKIGTKVIIHN